MMVEDSKPFLWPPSAVYISKTSVNFGGTELDFGHLPKGAKA